MTVIKLLKPAIILLLCLASLNAFSIEKVITFATNPTLNHATIQVELEPVKAELKKHGYSLQIIFPKDWTELISLTKQGVPDFLYTGYLSATKIALESNYTPILQSLNPDYHVVIEKFDNAKLPNNHDIYIPKNDLSSNFYAYSKSTDNKDIDTVKLISSEHILIEVLKHEGAKAIISQVTLDFLPANL